MVEPTGDGLEETWNRGLPSVRDEVEAVMEPVAAARLDQPVWSIMNGCTGKPTLIFPDEDRDEASLSEIAAKEWYGRAIVRLPSGDRVHVEFFTLRRLALQASGPEWGGGGRALTIPGLIIVPEVTVDAMKAAVDLAFDRGFFDHLRPA